MLTVILRRAASRRPQFSNPFRPSSTSPPKHRPAKFLTSLSLASAASLTAYTLGSIYPPTTLALLFPRPAPAPPTDPTSPSSLAYTAALEAQLQALPALTALRTRPDAAAWYETRPYKGVAEERRANTLVAGALGGPGRLALLPVLRGRADESEAWMFVHVGRGVCGHDGIVHGGLLATLLDESLARVAILNLPEKVGVTANLSIDYRAPTRADQFIVLKVKLIEAKGRKTVVGGRAEDMQGTVLAEATATFVQPKYAKLLNKASIKQLIGEHEPAPVHLADGEKA